MDRRVIRSDVYFFFYNDRGKKTSKSQQRNLSVLPVVIHSNTVIIFYSLQSYI